MLGETTERGLETDLRRLGLSPARARRMVEEWQDHLEDLTDAGHAKQFLGSREALMESVRARPELRSWAARYPWVCFALLPVLCLTVSVTGLILGALYVVELHQEALMPLDQWYQDVAQIGFWSVTRVVPLVLVAAVAFSAARRRVPAAWPMVGIGLTLMLGAALGIHAEVDPLLLTGSLSLSLDLLPPYGDMSGFAVRYAAGLLLVLLPYLVWLRAEARSARRLQLAQA